MFDQPKALELIASGSSLREVGEQIGCSPAYICKVAASDPLFCEQYAHAMELRADWHAAKIEDLADKVEQGLIPPDAGRVAIDARKWTAAKLRPKRYGDKVMSEVDMTLRISIDDPTRNVRATAKLIK
jgi:hypothetical protein